MRVRLLLLASLTILLNLISPEQSKATHAMGLDLSWSCLGGNQYQFTLNFYRDCDGVNAPASVSIQLNSATCGQSTNVFCPLVVGSGIEVSPLCPAQLGNSACNTGSLPGVQQYTYQGTITLPAQCPDWVVSFDECCRNTTITNLVNPSAQSALVTGTLNNTGGLCNSSPQFTSLPVPYICNGQPYCYNHGAVDPDGDSLVYTLVDPLDGPRTTTPPYGTPIAHSGGLSATNPITNTAFTFDPQTGSMCLTPTGVQKAVIAIRVDEYRNGVLIGYTTRDIQVVVQNCINVQPDHVPRDFANLSGGSRVDSNSIEICPGVPLAFDLQFADQNAGDSVYISTNLNTAIPGATMTTSYPSPNDTLVASFSWTPTVNDVGFHNFTVTIRDDGCPILGAQIFNFDITVVPSTEIQPDTAAYCTAGGPIQLNAVGGTIFTWTTLSGDAGGLSCTNCANPQATPNTTSVYEVTSDLSPVCKNKDTVLINFVPSFALNAGNDTTICENGVAQINASATPGGLGPFSYVWSPADSLSSTSIPNPVASPLDSTQYVLTVTSAAGCIISDTLNVNVNGTAPLATISPLDTLCSGDSILLRTVISQPCGITANPCTGPSSSGQVGTTGVTFDVNSSPANFNGFSSTAHRVQIIYKKSELDAIGFLGGGRINSITLQFASAGGTAVPDMQIRMGCTSDSAFTTLPFLNGLSLVKNAFTLNPATGGQTITLDFPYVWDGQSNLIVEFCANTAALGTSSFMWATNHPASTRVRYGSVTSSGSCAIASGALGNNVPVMGFNFCEALPAGLTYAWTPSTGLSATNVPEPNASPATTTTYTFTVDDGLCIGGDVATLTVAPSFSIFAGNDTTLCKNVPLQMNGQVPPGFGPYTYNWSPGNLGVSDSTIFNPLISAPDTTTYIFSAKSANGCELTDTITINIDGISPLVEAGLNDTVCPGTGAALNTLVSQSCGPTTDPCTGPVMLDAVGDTNSATFLGLTGPFYNSAGGTNPRTQYIFTAAELQAMGFSGGKITQIGFDVGGTSIAPFASTDLAIRMGCTSLSTFPPSNTFEGGLTTVFSSGSFQAVLGTNMITLTTAYNWDGSSNLLIEICHNTSRTPGNDAQVRYQATTGNTVLTASLGVGNNCNVATGDFALTLRPVVRFQFCQSTPVGLNYTWSPATGISNTSIPNPTATPTQTTQYQVLVSDGGPCSGQDFVTVAIDSTNYVDAIADTLVVCPGDSAILGALVTGPPQPAVLSSCGVNGTPCTQSAYGITLALPGTTQDLTASPLKGGNTDARMQCLVRASDIIAAGGASGILMNMSLNVSNVLSSQSYDDWTIKLGCTSSTSLNGTTWEPTSTVYVASNFTPSTGWNTFNFSFPFDWDGTSNIVVEFCFNNATGTASDLVEVRTPTPFYTATQFAQNNSGTADGCALPNPLSVSSTLPDMQFTICNPVPNTFSYAWSPSTSLSNPNIQNPVATPGSNITYTVTVTGGNCPVQDTITLQAPPTCGLPLDAILLEGRRVDKVHELYFSSLNERDMDRFIIERAGPDMEFVSLGELYADGNTQGKTDYTFDDILPMNGENWYRITGVDHDGETKSSNRIVLVFTDESAITGVYPNPVEDGNSLFLEYYSSIEEEVSVDIVDILGRKLMGNRIQVATGQHTYEVNIAGLSAGSYFLRVRNSQGFLTKKVMVTR